MSNEITSNKLQDLLKTQPYLLADGATGTNLFPMGLQQGHPPELWNVEEPEKIIQHHKAFLNAGAQIILTNSFGGTRNRLKLHKGADERVSELNQRAAELVREAIKQSGKDAVVAGSMGPTGDLYEPVGPLSIEDGAKAFAEQAQALEKGGADVLWIETLSSLEEVQAAVQGAATTNLPFVVTASFDSKGKTMMGLSPEQFADALREMQPRPFAFGANCGTGTADLSAALLGVKNQDKADDILIAKSNAGVPEFKDSDFVYSGTPEQMSRYACLVRDMGVQIIGGCCGTTPAHLQAMKEALENTPKGGKPNLDTITSNLGELSSGKAVATPHATPERSGRRRRGQS